MVKDYLKNNTCLTYPLINVIVDNSSFAKLYEEDQQFVGHYPEEYWAEYILNECKEMIERCLKAVELYGAAKP